MTEYFDGHTASRPPHRNSKATLPGVAPAGRARPERDARRLSFVAGGLVRRVAVLRVVFGIVWAIDAHLKWQPAFISGYAPHLLAYLTAAIETAIAVGLILGLGRRVLYIGGMLWSIGIWTIPEGFGGSFLSGATDIGTAIMYALVFAILYSLEGLPTPTGMWSLDDRIARSVPWWRVVAEPGAHVAELTRNHG